MYRVLDLTTGIAGPLAAMLLADFGADVVKAEPPAGDPGRARPGFTVFNRNKRSLVLDPGTEDGRAMLESLLAGADVCVTGSGSEVSGLGVGRVSSVGERAGDAARGDGCPFQRLQAFA